MSKSLAERLGELGPHADPLFREAVERIAALEAAYADKDASIQQLIEQLQQAEARVAELERPKAIWSPDVTWAERRGITQDSHRIRFDEHTTGVCQPNGRITTCPVHGKALT